MKLSATLPIFVAGNKGDRGASEPFLASEVTVECSDQVRGYGGIFETTNNGSSGSLKLDKYRDNTDCKHVVQADRNCQTIRINYQSIMVEAATTCELDSFRFGWSGSTGFEVTPARCYCFEEGCDSATLFYDSQYGDQYDDYYPYEFDEIYAESLGPDSFTINSNSFTFFFRSDHVASNGHVVFDWECVDSEPTTTSSATPSTTSTTTS